MTNETTTTTTEKKVSMSNKIRAYKLNNPKAQPKDIAKELGVPVMRVYAVSSYDAQKQKAKKRKTLVLKKAALMGMQAQMDADKVYELTKGRERRHPVTGKLLMQGHVSLKPTPDNVNHPAHYKVGGIETIDFIEAKKLSYNLGNVVKYITRADHKGNTIEDLQKARWYLNREIANHTGAK